MPGLARLTSNQIQQVNAAVDHYNTLVWFIRHTLRDGLDYGTIPGCGNKPILFKPGAEKICTLFGYWQQIERLEAVKDWTGNEHGEPFFSFEYLVTLKSRSGDTVAQCVGSCNSWEEKYRFRTTQRTCPECNTSTIMTSKYGAGGFYCNKKAGGCGAKFAADDRRITDQAMGKVRNDRVFDQINTIDKMAQKRGFVGAVIVAANASNFFSVEHSEIESLDPDWEPVESIQNAQPMSRADDIEVTPDSPDLGAINRDRIREITSVTGHTREQIRALSGVESSERLSQEECTTLIERLLLDYASTRNVGPALAADLIVAIKKQQPNVTDAHLRDRFLVRLDEIKAELPATRPVAETYAGVSIE
ncbi:MAG: hypothetical protein AAF215_05445 [Cyanobacteria bacterium P01_A01_bin.123]